MDLLLRGEGEAVVGARARVVQTVLEVEVLVDLGRPTQLARLAWEALIGPVAERGRWRRRPWLLTERAMGRRRFPTRR